MPNKNNSLLTRAESYLANALRSEDLPAITPYSFFCRLQTMYGEGRNLYLRHSQPSLDDYFRFVKKMYKAGLIRYDRDYGKRLIRVLEVSERSIGDVICLADPLCYISHLSAMQRWGLTNRAPRVLTYTRPDKNTAAAMRAKIMVDSSYPLPPKRVQLKNIQHPDKVREIPLHVFDSKNVGAYVRIPDTSTRIATIGQTFLDMLQHPRQCGGMPHVLDIYEEHAHHWTDEIVNAVETCSSNLVKSRAGYILEERLGFSDRRIESWKSFTQRGGSRKLDPQKNYSPIYSETWMISVNV